MRVKKILLSLTKWFLCILVLSTIFSLQTVSAEGGEGSGGGKSEPLALVSSSIVNGETNVSLKPEIKLTFSKNIVNMKVVENNKNCFSLITADGSPVPFSLILADDQIDFERRNDAVIIPKVDLNPGTTYSVKISSSLQSKSGVTTGKETKITFTTKEAAKSTTETDKPKTDNKKETVASPPEQKKQTNTSATSSKTESKPNQNAESEQKQATDSNTDTKTEADSGAKTTNEDTSVVKESSNSDIDENSVEEAKEFTPYESTASKTVEKETKSSSSNRSLTVYLIIGILILAGASIFFILRMKKAK